MRRNNLQMCTWKCFFFFGFVETEVEVNFVTHLLQSFWNSNILVWNTDSSSYSLTALHNVLLHTPLLHTDKLQEVYTVKCFHFHKKINFTLGGQHIKQNESTYKKLITLRKGWLWFTICICKRPVDSRICSSLPKNISISKSFVLSQNQSLFSKYCII